MEERMNKLLELGYSPREVRGIFYEEIQKVLDKVLSENFFRITFDSPRGHTSKVILSRIGYRAEWFGHDGCRGETRVYLAKTCQSFENLKRNLEELELLDKDSKIQEL